MAISTTITRVEYVGNASTITAYPITFRYFSNSHVTIYADDVDITSACTFAGDGDTETGEFTSTRYRTWPAVSCA